MQPGTPVLLMSGYMDEDTVRRSFSEPDAVLAKPFTADALFARVRDLIGVPKRSLVVLRRHRRPAAYWPACDFGRTLMAVAVLLAAAGVARCADDSRRHRRRGRPTGLGRRRLHARQHVERHCARAQ